MAAVAMVTDSSSLIIETLEEQLKITRGNVANKFLLTSLAQGVLNVIAHKEYNTWLV